MPTTTTNYDFVKPLVTEDVDISVINANLDSIDSIIKSLDDANCKKTTADISMEITSDEEFDAAMVILEAIQHNDFDITITGTYENNEKIITIASISGGGSISFVGAFTVGGMLVSDVANRVLFPFGSELNVEQTTQYGFHAVNSPYIYINEINSSFESNPLSNWCLVRLENSKLVCLTPDFDGQFASASAPTYLIRLDSKSQILLGTDYNVKTNAIAGSSIGRSMIQVEDGGLFDTSAEALFDVNWSQNYACQLEMIVYPKSDFIYYINTETGLTYAKNIVSQIREVNCTIETVGINPNVSDLTLENITGCGSITLNSATFVLDNFIRNCTCDINITDVEVKDSATNGKYGLSVVNCRNVKMLTQTVLDAGTRSYEALLVDNSKVYFEDLRYINDPAVDYTNYVNIVNNSTVDFERILSGAGDTDVSRFITVLGSSRVHVREWAPANAGTTKLEFNDINSASYVIGYDESFAYKMALSADDLTIVEM